MDDGKIVLTREKRDEILRALKAIQRQLGSAVDTSNWQALYVIGSNLTIIESSITDLPRTSSN